jgi:hypothetical protein
MILSRCLVGRCEFFVIAYALKSHDDAGHATEVAIVAKSPNRSCGLGRPIRVRVD